MTPLFGILFLFIIAYLGSFIFQKYHLSNSWIKVPLYSVSVAAARRFYEIWQRFFHLDGKEKTRIVKP